MCPACQKAKGTTRRLSRLLLVLAWGGGPAAALAESLDRTALEQLFGEPVTTSATGKPQRASDVPVAMDIITAEQIRRSGARDIPGVLARYTSLDIMRYGPDDYSVSARGYALPNTPRMLVLVDGRQVYLDDYGRTIWSAIPVQLAEIRQIEVVRGPNSALFGFNAVAGVINIVTWNPARDLVNSIVLRGGTGRYGELSAVGTAKLPADGGLRISTGLRRQNVFSDGYGPDEQRTAPRNAQLATTAEIGVAEGVRVGFDASYVRASADALVPSFFVRERTETWSLRGRGSAETDAGLIEMSAYHNGLSYRVSGTPAWQQGVTTIELSDTVKLGAAHTVRPFLQYRRNELRESEAFRVSNYSTGASVRVGYQVVSAGGMWNWAIADGVEWTAAVRYDHLWLNGTGYDGPQQPFPTRDYDHRAMGTLAWNAALVWKPTGVDTLRLSAARGIESPSLLEFGARVSGASGGQFGSPFAPTTVVDNYEAGYRRRLERLSTDLDLAGFIQANRALSSSFWGMPILMPPAVAMPVTVPYSLGTSKQAGVEIALTIHLGAFEIGTKYRGAFIGGDLASSMVDYVHASPRHIATAHLGWTRDRWEADLFARYASSSSGVRLLATGTTVVTVKDYVTAAARIACRITPKLTVALEAEDMLQARQAQSIGTFAERRVYLSLRADF
ncbi:TonB-dependent receptor plug domain-containing protein [Rhodovastum atsumiense]|uniref:TonB-dependent receptor plug domain-containing protein n=1 Tax=Rhodovastum atsumiense TaxID=504468 RepID=A0A5M6IJB8_9PROT|nr:TonB-dependent receptor [Rhodovastum atsumiense]KAA5608364.1 TonB-dependent receptor plug domain-containing protein [Rhodovastum atsumiense]CAH2600499.1 TonB-dependent receptor plug domain-containing protein [Rhodovastum atsumiense]